MCELGNNDSHLPSSQTCSEDDTSGRTLQRPKPRKAISCEGTKEGFFFFCLWSGDELNPCFTGCQELDVGEQLYGVPVESWVTARRSLETHTGLGAR